MVQQFQDRPDHTSYVRMSSGEALAPLRAGRRYRVGRGGGVAPADGQIAAGAEGLD